MRDLILRNFQLIMVARLLSTQFFELRSGHENKHTYDVSLESALNQLPSYMVILYIRLTMRKIYT